MGSGRLVAIASKTLIGAAAFPPRNAHALGLSHALLHQIPHTARIAPTGCCYLYTHAHPPVPTTATTNSEIRAHAADTARMIFVDIIR